MIDLKELEQALTAYFASALDLTVDAGIFRGGLPHGVTPAVAVFLNGAEIFDDYRPVEYAVQILGRYADRDDAWKLVNAVSKLVPVYGRTVGNYRLPYLLNGGTGAPYLAATDGEAMWYASVNLRCAALRIPTPGR